LGLPISISPDDPARFGYNGTTPDYYIITHGFHFDLKDLKLIALYSI
jgi:adenosine deaminase